MIGVGVEGPSDMHFWRKVLHRIFPGHRFDVHNLRTREQLIRKAPRLWDSFRDARYAATLLIIDRDNNPCYADVVRLFDPRIAQELAKPRQERRLFLAMAARKVESWFLADPEAVRHILPHAQYEVPDDADIWGVGRLEKLWRERYGANSTLNKIEFAKLIAPFFMPDRARENSSSLSRAWASVLQAVSLDCS